MTTDNTARANEQLASSDLLGMSLPSDKHGAWIVQDVRGTRCRLVTANLMGEQWIDTARVRELLEKLGRISPKRHSAVTAARARKR